MSVYDQRMNSPSNVYYFQLVPLLLVPLTDSPAPKALIFQLFKNQNLCDSSKNPIEILQVGKQIKIPKAFINFNISLLDLDNAPPVNLVIESHPTKNQSSYNEADFSDDNNKENQADKKMTSQFGNCFIQIKSMIQQFNQNGLKSFDQKMQINKDFQLVFSIYIERTRFALEKYVRSTREKQLIKKQKNQDNNPFYTNQNKVSSQGRRINVEEVIVSLKPSKNTPKSSDYALKKSLNLNKNYLTIDQQSAEQRSRSVNKEENEKQKINEIEKLKTQSQQKNINGSQIDDDPLRDIDEDFNNINEQQIIEEIYSRNQTQQQEPIFQMTKSYTQKQTPKSQKVKKDIEMKIKIKEQQRENTMAQEKITEKKHVNQKNNKINWTTSHAIAIALSVFMFLLMINVMSPSRKV